MNKFQILITTLVFIFSISVSSAQVEPYQDLLASNDSYVESPRVKSAIVNTSNTSMQDQLVSEAFLDANNGFVGIVFNKDISDPNIYYKIVDANGTEIYKGSAHAYLGSNPTLYYNTENLPKGDYRIFIESENFFLSTEFSK